MARFNKPVAYRVDIIESELGWGSKIDQPLYFDDEAEARKFCEDFNAGNTLKTVPNWYMIADYRGLV